MLSLTDHDRVCEVRERTGWGPRLIAAEVEIPHATVSRMLRRRGCSRRPRPDRGEVFRHEWPCPGDLLQMDVKRFARFSSPGHAVTGDRTRSGTERRERVGYEFAHSVIDDHSRGRLYRDPPPAILGREVLGRDPGPTAGFGRILAGLDPLRAPRSTGNGQRPAG